MFYSFDSINDSVQFSRLRLSLLVNDVLYDLSTSVSLIKLNIVCVAVFLHSVSRVVIELVEMFFLEMLENHLHVVSKSIILAVVVREHSKVISDILSDCLDIVEKNVC